MLDEYRVRRDQLCTWLAEEPRIRLVKPAGAFYLFPDVSDFLSPDGVRTTAELAQSLLDGPRVAVTPGEAFDAPGFLRISYAASMEDLRARRDEDHRAPAIAVDGKAKAASRSLGPCPHVSSSAICKPSSARSTSAPTTAPASTYGTDALKQRPVRRCSSSSRRRPHEVAAIVRAVRRAPDARSCRAAPAPAIPAARCRRSGGVVLSLERMNRILEIDEANLLAVVEPNVITGDLQDAVEKVGLFYPPDPASLRQSVIGGNVAECAGGPRAFKYGTTKQYVLGLEAVLPTGEIVETGGKVVKNVVGYDLTQLLVGSEGTLAIITQDHPAADSEAAGASDAARDVPDRRSGGRRGVARSSARASCRRRSS